jgi:outer membrane protein assembly factor BamB
MPQPQQPGVWPAQPGATPAQPSGQWPAQPGVPQYQPGIPATPPAGMYPRPPSGITVPPAAAPLTPQPPAPLRPPAPMPPPSKPAQPSSVRPAPPQPAKVVVPTAPAKPAAPLPPKPAALPPKQQQAAPAAPKAPLETAPKARETDKPQTRPAPPAEQRRPPASAAPQQARKPLPPAQPPCPAIVEKPQPARKVVRTPASRPEQFVWAFPEDTATEGEPLPLRNAPAVDAAGRIFLHVRGRLFALEEVAEKPKVLWEYLTGKHAPGPVVIGPADTVYVHATDGYLHCVDAISGKQNWPPAYVGEPLGYAAPIVDHEGNAWISAFDGGLIKVDAQGKTQKPGRYFRSRQKFDSAAVLIGGVLYAAAESGYVFAIQSEGDKGVNLWNHAGDHGFAGWCINSAPAMTEDGILVVPGHNETLLGFNAGGSSIWKTQMPGQMLGSPVLDRYGHIYVGASHFPRGKRPRGLLVCVDGNSHKVRWEYHAAGAVESTPVIGDDDVIYFGDNTGTIHAVDLLGNGLWTAEVGEAVRSAGTIPAPQRVAFGLDDETLVVLRCSSQGLAQDGWPKIGRTLGQSGTR